MALICAVRHMNQKRSQNWNLFLGAIEGARSRDLRLGKPTLYQLSYYRIAPANVIKKAARLSDLFYFIQPLE